jgi:hypothetical protein
MMLGRKANGGSSFFKKAYHNAPRFFSKVAGVADIVKKGAGALSLVVPEFAPALATIGGVAEGVSQGSKVVKGYLEKNSHNRLHGKM